MLKYVTPPTASGSQSRIWQTIVMPLCWQPIGRSRNIAVESLLKKLTAWLRYGEAYGPALRSAVMSRAVPS